MINRMLFNKETTWDSLVEFLEGHVRVIVNSNLSVYVRVENGTIEFETMEFTLKFNEDDFDCAFDPSMGYYGVWLTNESYEMVIYELTIPKGFDFDLDIIAESTKKEISDEEFGFLEEYLVKVEETSEGKFIKTYVYGDDYQGKFIDDLIRSKSA